MEYELRSSTSSTVSEVFKTVLETPNPIGFVYITHPFGALLSPGCNEDLHTNIDYLRFNNTTQTQRKMSCARLEKYQHEFNKPTYKLFRNSDYNNIKNNYPENLTKTGDNTVPELRYIFDSIRRAWNSPSPISHDKKRSQQWRSNYNQLQQRVQTNAILSSSQFLFRRYSVPETAIRKFDLQGRQLKHQQFNPNTQIPANCLVLNRKKDLNIIKKLESKQTNTDPPHFNFICNCRTIFSDSKKSCTMSTNIKVDEAKNRNDTNPFTKTTENQEECTGNTSPTSSDEIVAHVLLTQHSVDTPQTLPQISIQDYDKDQVLPASPTSITQISSIYLSPEYLNKVVNRSRSSETAQCEHKILIAKDFRHSPRSRTLTRQDTSIDGFEEDISDLENSQEHKSVINDESTAATASSLIDSLDYCGPSPQEAITVESATSRHRFNRENYVYLPKVLPTDVDRLQLENSSKSEEFSIVATTSSPIDSLDYREPTEAQIFPQNTKSPSANQNHLISIKSDNSPRNYLRKQKQVYMRKPSIPTVVRSGSDKGGNQCNKNVTAKNKKSSPSKSILDSLEAYTFDSKGNLKCKKPSPKNTGEQKTNNSILIKGSGKQKNLKKITIFEAQSSIVTPDQENGPKRFYQKTEISDGEKKIDILEIVECLQNHGNFYQKKYSKIPVPISKLNHLRKQKSGKKLHQKLKHVSLMKDVKITKSPVVTEIHNIPKARVSRLSQYSNGTSDHSFLPKFLDIPEEDQTLINPVAPLISTFNTTTTNSNLLPEHDFIDKPTITSTKNTDKTKQFVSTDRTDSCSRTPKQSHPHGNILTKTIMVREFNGQTIPTFNQKKLLQNSKIDNNVNAWRIPSADFYQNYKFGTIKENNKRQIEPLPKNYTTTATSSILTKSTCQSYCRCCSNLKSYSRNFVSSPTLSICSLCSKTFSPYHQFNSGMMCRALGSFRNEMKSFETNCGDNDHCKLSNTSMIKRNLSSPCSCVESPGVLCAPYSTDSNTLFNSTNFLPLCNSSSSGPTIRSPKLNALLNCSSKCNKLLQPPPIDLKIKQNNSNPVWSITVRGGKVENVPNLTMELKFSPPNIDSISKPEVKDTQIISLQNCSDSYPIPFDLNHVENLTASSAADPDDEISETDKGYSEYSFNSSTGVCTKRCYENNDNFNRAGYLSVMGNAIAPEPKPRVPTMSEKDLTRRKKYNTNSKCLFTRNN